MACNNNSDKNNDEPWSIERVYALAQENGFEGSLEDFITLFKGEKGNKGDKGEQGDKGVQGEQGDKGLDGIGIKSAYIDEYGHLILVLTNDTTIDAGAVKTEKPEIPFTDGLSYQARGGNQKSYAVSGVGSVAEYDIVIPETLNGCPVVGIMDNAFENNTFIRSVSIPDSVTFIGSRAFSGCSSLKSVTIGKGMSKIEISAFLNCNSLEKFHISDVSAWCDVILDDEEANPLYYAQNLYLNGKIVDELIIPNDVTQVERYTFLNGKNITNISIPDSVKEIGENVFDGTAYFNNESNWDNGVLYIGKHLIRANNTISEEYTIKADTLTIADRAFQLCSNLKSVIIPEGITWIPYCAFLGCDNLQNVQMGSKVKMIYVVAFSGCKSMTSITIPNSVTSIESWAFYNCDSLTNIYYDGTMAQWNAIDKGKEWDYSYNNSMIQRSYMIHCTDGDIQVN